MRTLGIGLLCVWFLTGVLASSQKTSCDASCQALRQVASEAERNFQGDSATEAASAEPGAKLASMRDCIVEATAGVVPHYVCRQTLDSQEQATDLFWQLASAIRSAFPQWYYAAPPDDFSHTMAAGPQRCVADPRVDDAGVEYAEDCPLSLSAQGHSVVLNVWSIPGLRARSSRFGLACHDALCEDIAGALREQVHGLGHLRTGAAHRNRDGVRSWHSSQGLPEFHCEIDATRGGLAWECVEPYRDPAEARARFESIKSALEAACQCASGTWAHVRETDAEVQLRTGLDDRYFIEVKSDKAGLERSTEGRQEPYLVTVRIYDEEQAP